MSVVKVLEVISEGSSVDDAVANAVKEVTKTVTDVVQIDVEHISAHVTKNKITKYRVRSKVSFIVKNGK